MNYYLAQARTINDLVQTIVTEAINPLIRLLFAIAFAIFIWGIVTYVIGTRGDEKKIAQGKKVILWGLIGLFIMASAWGIIKLFCNFFGTDCPGGGRGAPSLYCQTEQGRSDPQCYGP